MLIKIDEETLIETNNILTITLWDDIRSSKWVYGITIKMKAPVYDNEDNLILKEFKSEKERDKFIEKLKGNSERNNTLIKEIEILREENSNLREAMRAMQGLSYPAVLEKRVVMQKLGESKTEGKGYGELSCNS